MIEVQLRRILAHKIRVAEQILAGLVKSGQMRATPAEIATLAQTALVVMVVIVMREDPMRAIGGEGGYPWSVE